MPDDWEPTTDRRVTVCEVTQQLIRALDEGGESVGQIPRDSTQHADLAQRHPRGRLAILVERKKWAQEAPAYNSLVIAWPEITRLAARRFGPAPGRLF